MPILTYEDESCPNCGVRFGVPYGFKIKRQEDKAIFYCPNGHSICYAVSTAEKLRRENERLIQRLAEKDDAIKYQQKLREETERKLVATRGVVTRIRKRVSHGVCPCCNRTFGDLARHMATKHPTYTVEAAE